MREVTLPSGAVLKIQPAPFADAKTLYQALLREMRGISISGGATDAGDIIKNVFCAGFSSPEIDVALQKCLTRCIYASGGKELKIDKDTFEPVECRQDYVKACVEVTKENVDPFAQGLFADFKTALSALVVIRQ